ncbi:Uncharacterized protein SCF082_LOCUS53298 [Durusdinium trenchii]|uniref:C2H2-type domain-containing protein n=1 Tax=Durusdinium trenchii TaxID=1381693 RepID=A0ABP0SRW7_9DINO
MPRIFPPAADAWQDLAFQRCRYCTRWKDLCDFSVQQLQWAEAQAQLGRRPTQREPVCRACAGFALQAEAPTTTQESQRSVSVEARYALILAFCGEYEGLPEFNEDILRCIISFLVVRVAPFISDLGVAYRCVACQRDFQSLEHVLQHAQTSKRHTQALKEAAGDSVTGGYSASGHPSGVGPSAPPGDEDAGLAHLRGAQTPQGRLQAWMLEETPEMFLREASLGTRAAGLNRVEDRQRKTQAAIEGQERRAQLRSSVVSSEAVRLEAEKEALDRKRHALDMREQHLLRSQGTAAGDEAVAQRVLHQVQEEKQEQDMLFSQWRAEVQEARAELHDQMRNSIRKDFAEARENQLYQEIHFQSQQLKRLNEITLKQQHELDTVRESLERRHEAAMDNYRFGLEAVQEQFAECREERDELKEELQDHKVVNDELKREVEALEQELEAIGRFRTIEAEQQQRLRTLLASSDRDRRPDVSEDVSEDADHTLLGGMGVMGFLTLFKKSKLRIGDVLRYLEEVLSRRLGLLASIEACFCRALNTYLTVIAIDQHDNADPGLAMARATVLARPAGNLRRVAGDLEKVHGFCHDHGIQICASSIFDELLTKKSLLQRVQRFFEIPEKLLILFYAGHGRPGTGDWILEDEDAALVDVLHLWEASHSYQRGAVLLVISDACYSGGWVSEAARLQASQVVVQSSCASWERALDGVFISLWLLVQRSEVAPLFALKHLESLERHPCTYFAPELNGGHGLPGLGPKGPPPTLLQLKTCNQELASGTSSRRASLLHFARLDHHRARRRAAQRRGQQLNTSREQNLENTKLENPGLGLRPYPKGDPQEPEILLAQLAAAKQPDLLQSLLDAACVAAAKDELRPELSRLKLQDLLGSILLQAAACQFHGEVAQASLCCLWNLAKPLQLRVELVTSGLVPHALKDVAEALGSCPLVLEWCARVVWLLSEEPRAREALLACDLPAALQRQLPGTGPSTQKWVLRALTRLDGRSGSGEQKGSEARFKEVCHWAIGVRGKRRIRSGKDSALDIMQLAVNKQHEALTDPVPPEAAPSFAHAGTLNNSTSANFQLAMPCLAPLHVFSQQEQPGAMSWADGENQATKDWQRCLLTHIMIRWASMVEELMSPRRLLRVLRPWMPFRGSRPDVEGMTWMQAEGRIRRQADRTCLRDALRGWHGHVSSLLPAVQLLCWLRPFIPHRGLTPEQEEERVFTWAELERRMKEQNFRFCRLMAFHGWISWMASERQPGSVMWVIDTSRWPKPQAPATDRPWAAANFSERRKNWAQRKALKLKEEEEERQRVQRLRAEEQLAELSARRPVAEESGRRSTLRPYEFPAVLRSDRELSPRTRGTPRDPTSP